MMEEKKKRKERDERVGEVCVCVCGGQVGCESVVYMCVRAVRVCAVCVS
jgi:hypothetical protein